MKDRGPVFVTAWEECLYASGKDQAPCLERYLSNDISFRTEVWSNSTTIMVCDKIYLREVATT
ncbi:hypothetical protein NC651_015569 [Populus alba x Populus x berolinensis]|nr:hypothetical protein NC651_015569 [Populus alba x Populus x berolinensis]